MKPIEELVLWADSNVETVVCSKVKRALLYYEGVRGYDKVIDLYYDDWDLFDRDIIQNIKWELSEVISH